MRKELPILWCPMVDKEATVECHLYDPEKDETITYHYCDEHASKNGFCIICGEFWGGIEEFEFSEIEGVCPNCIEGMDIDEGDDIGDFGLGDGDKND